MEPIAHIRTDFSTKFGVPRQAGLVPALRGRVVFAPDYRNPDALRGLEGFSHVWLIWEFSEAKREQWSPTVRPPRLGGNVRMGVFATRSPFRPNPIGLSCVKLEGIVSDPALGPVLEVSGADLMDGTPILDIKPYLPYCDSHPEASSGFTGTQTPNLPYHISLATYPLEMENEVLANVKKVASEFSQVEMHLSHIGMFAGGQVLFAAPERNPELDKLQEACQMGVPQQYGFTPHTTILIDDPEVVHAALPTFVKCFRPMTGRITRLHLCAFWPTREIAALELKA